MLMAYFDKPVYLQSYVHKTNEYTTATAYLMY